MWKNEKFSHTSFAKISSNQLFSNFFVRQLLSRNFCEKVWERISAFSTAQCGKTKNSVSPKIFSSNLLFSDFFGKNVTFTKFLPKMCETKSQCGKTWNSLPCNFFRQISFRVNFFSKKLIWWNFLQQNEVEFWNFHRAHCGKMKNLVSLKRYFVKSTL